MLVLDALDMALWQRGREEHSYRRGEFTHHPDAGSQYTSFRLAERPGAVGIAASIGDAYDGQPVRTGSRKDRVAPAVTA